MSDYPDRNAIRTAFAELLRPFYVPDRLAADVIDHYTEDLGGMTPVVVCADSGLEPLDLTPRGYQVGVYLAVMHFVLKGEALNPGYTAADADAKLSAMTVALMRAVQTVQAAGLWLDITFNGRSSIKQYRVGGKIYWGEVFELRFLAL